VEESNLSITLAFNCEHCYAEKDYVVKRERDPMNWSAGCPSLLKGE